MTTMVPVREWTCSQHDYPDQCECCETWHCDECQRSGWVTVGEREATGFEELLLRMPPPKFPDPLLFERILDLHRSAET